MPGGWHTALRFSPEEVAGTPSRSDGITEKVERAERFEACELARRIVRHLLSSDDKELDDTRGKVQVLACYYLQLFFMSRSLREESTTVVAVAAAFLACKVGDAPKRIRDVLRAHGGARKPGEAELGEEELKVLRDRIPKVELRLLQIIRFNFDIALPLEEIDDLSERLLVKLAQSSTFVRVCGGKHPVAEANAMKPKLLQTAQSFANDSFCGFAPLLVPPRVLAAGALVVAVRYIKREITMDELYGLLEAADGSLDRPQLERAVDEIFHVYRTKSEAQTEGAKREVQARKIGSDVANNEAQHLKTGVGQTKAAREEAPAQLAGGQSAEGHPATKLRPPVPLVAPVAAPVAKQAVNAPTSATLADQPASSEGDAIDASQIGSGAEPVRAQVNPGGRPCTRKLQQQHEARGPAAGRGGPAPARAHPYAPGRA